MKFEKFFDDLYLYLGVPWLFLMLFTSGSLTEVKIGLMGLLFIVAVMEMGYRSIRIEQKYLAFVSIFIIYCSISLLLGLIGNFEFVLGKDIIYSNTIF